ncbi:family 20 glycosylhydrolase, partial [Yinghuangia sp. YIM S09857]|uniref:family 20 glycosylhydrolase n=1 Tax=Yinghuangia sp. YIM S09857 TaxID=3436929 RepID=UPI003F52EF3E
VRAHGKQPVGWQESSRAGIAAEDIGQFWITPEMMFPPGAETSPLGPELHAAVTAFFAPTADDLDRIVAGGGRVVLSPQSHVYLDRPHDPALTAAEQAETVARLGMPVYEARGVRTMADWNPADHGVPEAQVAGIEAALWAESITCFDDLTTLLLPRLPAVAETAWSGGPAEWSDYSARLARHAELWEQRGLAYLKTTEIDWEKR